MVRASVYYLFLLIVNITIIKWIKCLVNEKLGNCEKCLIMSDHQSKSQENSIHFNVRARKAATHIFAIFAQRKTEEMNRLC